MTLLQSLRNKLIDLAKICGNLRADRSASTAMTFALLTIPLIMSASLMIVYTDVATQRDRLNAAADAAALSAVSFTYITDPAEQAKKGASLLFNEKTAYQGVTVSSVDIAVTDTLTNRTATVQWSATVPTGLSSIFGVGDITITGQSSSVAPLPVYIDFYLLLDNTPSMGIGATPADIQTMVNNTPDQCGFACHDLASAPNDYYSKAKALGVTTRIDVVRSATQQLMDTATNTEYVNGQFRAAVYTFGKDATNLGLTNVAALSSDLATVKTQAGAVDLMTIPYQGYNNDQITNFNATLTSMNTTISSPGNGSGPGSPQKVVFLVSDGVADYANGSSCTRTPGGGRCIEPLNTSYCDTLKARGIRIAVLYTTYNPLPTNGFYNYWVSPFQATIGPNNMQTCASPGLYFEVSPTQGIAEAMKALFQKTVGTARLAQ